MIRIKRQIQKTNSGFSLLELLLVIAVIATLILSSTHFFSIVSENYKVARSLKDINIIRKATVEYCLDKPDYNTCLSGSSQDPYAALSKLYNAGLIPQDIGNGAKKSPWGTDILLVPNGYQLQIIISCPMPASSCDNLKSELQNQTISQPSCIAIPQCQNTFIATFGNLMLSQ